MSVTILYGERESTVDAAPDGKKLWMAPATLTSATGWQLKPEGACLGETCVPLPRDGSWLDGRGRLDLAALAGHMGQPVVRDDARDIWSFGESAESKGKRLRSGVAPDFTLPDLEGNRHSLSDYRGRKVFLYAWASW